MKKRMVALACAGVMAVSALAGCSSEKPAETAAKTEAQAAAAGETAAAAAEAAPKSDFPKKNIKIIVPYGAGGGVDITVRLLTDAAGKDYFNGKSLIVENKEGGGAVIGHTEVANAEPDGYTLIAYTNAIVNNPLLKEVTYTTDDFKTIGMVCFDPELLAVPPTAQYKTWDEFAAYAKENTVKLATPGHSTAHHIAAIKLANEMGFKFEYLHNDSSAVQMQQLMGGHCDAAMMAVGEGISAINDGTIIGIAMGGDVRNENIPDVPTFLECGSTLVDGAFRGLGCHKDVPDDVYQVLCSEFEKVMTSQKYIDAMNEAGIPYAFKNASDFQEHANTVAAALAELVPTLKQ